MIFGASGRIRTYTKQFLRLPPLPIALHWQILNSGTGGGIRTHTVKILSLVPLPNWATPAFNLWWGDIELNYTGNHPLLFTERFYRPLVGNHPI